MSRAHMRAKTMESLSDICAHSFTSDLAKSVFEGVPRSMQHKLRTELKKAENAAKTSYSKLILNKERRSELQRSQQAQRQQLERELLNRQERSQKNLQKLRASQQSLHKQNNDKLETVRSKHKEQVRGELVKTFVDFKKNQEQMVSFYMENEKKKKEYNDYLQSIHRKSVMSSSQPDGVSTRRASDYMAPYTDNKSYFQSSVRTSNQGRYLPTQNRKHIVREKQQQKEAKVLNEFMGKLEEIESIRNNRTNKMRKGPQKPILPLIKVQTRHIQNPEQKVTPSPPANVKRFSEEYARKLEQKRGFLEWSKQKRLSAGDNFLNMQVRITQNNKLRKLLEESKNQVRRRLHYSMMEKLKKAS